MSLRLKRPHGTMPPGGFPFTDPRTGKVFPPFEAFLDEQAAKIIHHRLANPHIYLSSDATYLDMELVKQEILAPLYLRHKELFEGESDSAAIVIQAKDLPVTAPGACKSCKGFDYESIFCTTGCASGKILGYKCRGCGRTRGISET